MISLKRLLRFSRHLRGRDTQFCILFCSHTRGKEGGGGERERDRIDADVNVLLLTTEGSEINVERGGKKLIPRNEKSWRARECWSRGRHG